jgi:glycosyltransferase involved in cell wall biosynthesis
MSQAAAPTVVAVVVTYRRPAVLAHLLDVLERQTWSLGHVVVVDNSPSPYEPASVGPSCTVVHTPENLGPAGGMQVGLRRAGELVADWDWALLLDDDDPPLRDDAVARMVAAAQAARAADPAVRLVGLLGSRLDRRTGLFATSCGARRTVPVDFVGGGYLPLLHRSAMRGDEGPFDPDLFWGCEELDAGLRVRARGGEVLAFDQLAEELGYWAKRDGVRSAQLEAPLERRYYAWRNAIAVCLTNRFRLAAAATALRVAASGLVGLVGLRGGPRRAVVAARAIRDGYGRRLGRVVDASK